ncbi:MAG: hypothetical protein ACRDTV_23880 [Mycobacterium sp.]
MKRVVVLSVLVVVCAELAALALPDRRFVLWASVAAAASGLLSLRRFVGHDVGSLPVETASGPEDSLRGWLSRTKTLIRWAESTRSDWDRHLRPILARRFAIATGQRQAKDPEAFHATGEMLFGTQLWAWVNPNNVAQTGGHEPGPGRATLEEILERLEQV